MTETETTTETKTAPTAAPTAAPTPVALSRYPGWANFRFVDIDPTVAPIAAPAAILEVFAELECVLIGTPETSVIAEAVTKADSAWEAKALAEARTANYMREAATLTAERDRAVATIAELRALIAPLTADVASAAVDRARLVRERNALRDEVGRAAYRRLMVALDDEGKEGASVEPADEVDGDTGDAGEDVS